MKFFKIVDKRLKRLILRINITDYIVNYVKKKFKIRKNPRNL